MQRAADFASPTEKLACNIKFLAADINVIPECIPEVFRRILGSQYCCDDSRLLVVTTVGF